MVIYVAYLVFFYFKFPSLDMPWCTAGKNFAMRTLARVLVQNTIVYRSAHPLRAYMSFSELRVQIKDHILASFKSLWIQDVQCP